MRQGKMLLVTLCSFTFAWATAFGADFAPPVPRGSIPLKKTGFRLSYNKHHKQADWVYYELGPDQLLDCAERANGFKADPALPEDVRANLDDYKGSGFDRGHLSPAGDNKWSEDAIQDSFLLSNVSPQPPHFNRGIWENLESLVRAWGQASGGVWVTTGPVLEDGLNTIGDDEISTPNSFYKVILTKSASHRSAIAFEVPVTANRGNLKQYAVSVDQLERDTGLQFLSGLGADEKDELERSVDLSGWDFSATFSYSPCRLSTVPGLQAEAPAGLGWFHVLN